MGLLDFIKLPLAQVMGGVLAASLALNVFLFFNGHHQVEKKVECTNAVQTANKVATEKKVIIERRQDNVTNETEVRLRKQLGSLRQQLHDVQSRQLDLPQPANTPEGTPSTDPATELLRQSNELICTINTATAEGWQKWWDDQVKIREEENAGPNPESSSVPSP